MKRTLAPLVIIFCSTSLIAQFADPEPLSNRELKFFRSDYLDIDMDGDLDIFFGGLGLGFYENLGNNNYSDVQWLVEELAYTSNFNADQEGYSVLPCNLNADDFIDFVTVHENDNIRTYTNSGGFQLVEQIHDFSAIRLRQVIDINNDGYDDVVYSISSGGVKDAILLTNGSGGALQAPIITTFNTTNPHGKHFPYTHLNSDNFPDCIVYNGSSFDVRLGDGSGNFVANQNLSLTFTEISYINQNNDGFTDLLVSYQSGLTISFLVYLNNGSAQFISDISTGPFDIPIFQPSTYDDNYQILDVDGDSDDDFLSIHYVNGTFIHYNNGALGYGVGEVLENGMGISGASVGDANGDDVLDLCFNLTTPHIGLGYFDGSTDFAFPVVSIIEGVLYGPDFPMLVDLNNDGRDDLIYRDRVDEPAIGGFAWNNDVLNFEPIPQQNIVVPATNQIFTVDIDNNGWMDILESNVSYLNEFGSFSIPYENYSGLSTYIKGYFDFDGDGDMDGLGRDNLNWYLMQNENGMLMDIGLPIPSSTIISAMDVLDIDNDGLLNIVGSNLTLLEVDAEFNWTTESLPAIPEGFYLKNVIDVNGDGYGDYVLSQDDFAFVRRYLAINDNGEISQEPTLLYEEPWDEIYDPAKIRWSDFDNNGIKDVMIMGHYFMKVLLFDDALNTIWSYQDTNYISSNGYWNENMAAGDIDGDGDSDIVFFAEQTGVKLHWMENLSQGNSSISGTVFLDENANGILDNGESGMSSIPVIVEPSNEVLYTMQNSGYYTLGVGSGSFQITVDENENLWGISNAEYPINVISDGINPISEINIGLVPLSEFMDLDITLLDPVGPCGGDQLQVLILNNIGTQVFNGTLELQFPAEFQFIGSDPQPQSNEANSLSYSIENLYPGSNIEIPIYWLSPSVDFMGQQFEFMIVATNTDLEILTQELDSFIFECAYDPNMKDVSPLGYTENGYVLNGESLEYTIHFQNTGTAVAYNVSIEDQLSMALNTNSIEIIGASHACVPSLNQSGLLKFYFPDIMLPDSTSDLEGSKGYVAFRIQMNENLLAWTEIANTAQIYFDNNPAIITNTVLNTIMECEGLADFTFDFDSGCPGTYVLGNANSDLGEIYSWTIDELEVSTGTNLYTALLESGTYDVVLNVTNPLCDVSSTQPFVVHEISTPVITFNGDQLVASGTGTFQWFLNGLVIEGANAAIYTPLEDGTYTVSVVDVNECYSISEEFTYTNLFENAGTFLGIQPNPFSDRCVIQIGDQALGTRLWIADIHGRIVKDLVVQSNIIDLDTSNWQSAVYIVHVGNTEVQRMIKE